MAIRIKAPLSREDARNLRSGDSCLLSGVIYTARDAAHKRLCELIEKGENALDSKTVTEAEKAGIEITVMASDENKGTVVRIYISHG